MSNTYDSNMKLAQAELGIGTLWRAKNVKPTWPPLTTIFLAMILLLFSLNLLLVVMAYGSYTFCTNDHPTISIHGIMVCSHWRCPTPGQIETEKVSMDVNGADRLGFSDQCAQNPFLRSISLCLFQCEYIIIVKQDWWQLQQLQEIIILLWTQRCKNLFAGCIVNLYIYIALWSCQVLVSAILHRWKNSSTKLWTNKARFFICSILLFKWQSRPYS